MTCKYKNLSHHVKNHHQQILLPFGNCKVSIIEFNNSNEELEYEIALIMNNGEIEVLHHAVDSISTCFSVMNDLVSRGLIEEGRTI